LKLTISQPLWHIFSSLKEGIFHFQVKNRVNFIRAVMVQGLERSAPIFIFRGSNPGFAKNVFLQDFEVLEGFSTYHSSQMLHLRLSSSQE
jgi:hypothetical protein